MMAKAVTFEAQLTIVLQKQVVDYVKFINNWFMLHYQQHAKHNKIILKKCTMLRFRQVKFYQPNFHKIQVI